MAEQNTKPEVSAAQASKRLRRMAKSDIFSGITATATATCDKDPPAATDVVRGMLIKNRDTEEEYVAASTDDKTALLDRGGDKLTDTELQEVPRVTKMLKRVLSKNKETEKPPDGDSAAVNGVNNEEVNTQAQPKLSRLLKRVLKDSRERSTEHDGTAEDASAEANNEDETLKEEEPIELSPSQKGLLVRALRKRAESRKNKGAAAEESSNKEKVDEEKREGEGDSQTKSETQAQPKLSRLLKRVLKDSREQSTEHDGTAEDAANEANNEDETPKEEESIELTPSQKGLMVRALRKRAESRKNKGTAVEESSNKEKVDEVKREGEGDSQTKTQAQPKLSRLLKRVLKDSRERSTEHDGTAEDAPAEANNEDEPTKEEESIELSPSQKGLLVRALRKRAESRKNKEAAVDESSNKEKMDEDEKEAESDSQTKSETQVQPIFARVLKRMLAEKRESQDGQDEEKNSEEQTAEEGPFQLTPSAKGVLVRALRNRAESRKKKEAAAEEGVNEEITDEGQSEKQVKPKFAKALIRMLTDQRESEDRQDEDNGEGGNEKKNEEQTAEVRTFHLSPSAKGVLLRGLRNRVEARKKKEAAAKEDLNKEIADEPDSKDQGQSEKQLQPIFARVLKRMLVEKRESQDSQDEDRGEGGKEEKNEEQTAEEGMFQLTPSTKGLLVRALKNRAESRKKKEAAAAEGLNNNENQSQFEKQAQGQFEGKADDEVINEDQDSANPDQDKTKVNRVVKRAFSKNKKRQEFQSASSQDEGFFSVVKRSMDLKDVEKRTESTEEQQDKLSKQGSIQEDNTTPQTVLEEKKDTGHGQEQIKAMEANGAKVEEVGAREEAVEEKTANDGDSPQVSTADSEPGRCSGACVII